jgi:hypothetical protein
VGARHRVRGELLEDRRLLALSLGGFELPVNATSAGEQRLFRESPQAIAMRPDGFGVVTWSSLNQDGSGWGVVARRIAPGGFPAGRELLVNTTTIGDQQYSSVAMAPDGRFVVTWRAVGNAGAFARRYSAGGVPQGPEFRVNEFDSFPSIAIDQDGNFTIVAAGSDEQGNGVFGQRFADDGSPIGTQFKINTVESDRDAYPQIAMEPDGDFVVTWTAPDDGRSSGVFARRFNALAAPLGEPFQVNETTTATQWFSTIDVDPSGAFVITWTGQDRADGKFSILARRYDAAGGPRSGEFVVSDISADDAQYSRIAVDDNGDFVIVWTARDLFSDGIFAKRFTAAGEQLEPPFQANVLGFDGVEQLGAVASDADGDFNVIWTRLLQDNTSWNIRIQAYNSNNPPVAADDVAQTNEITPILIPVLDNDVDADGQLDPSSVTVTLPPTHGTTEIDPTTGSILYTPAVGYVGPVTIGYTVADDELAVSNEAFVSIEIVPLLFRPWQNPDNIFDVDDDLAVSNLDALTIINALDLFGPYALTVPPNGAQQPPPFYDVSGDDFLSPLDAHLVINQLNLAPLPAPVPLGALADAAEGAGLPPLDLDPPAEDESDSADAPRPRADGAAAELPAAEGLAERRLPRRAAAKAPVDLVWEALGRDQR